MARSPANLKAAILGIAGCVEIRLRSPMSYAPDDLVQSLNHLIQFLN
jgi:hypothetical protein